MRWGIKKAHASVEEQAVIALRGGFIATISILYFRKSANEVFMPQQYRASAFLNAPNHSP